MEGNNNESFGATHFRMARIQGVLRETQRKGGQAPARRPRW